MHRVYSHKTDIAQEFLVSVARASTSPLVSASYPLDESVANFHPGSSTWILAGKGRSKHQNVSSVNVECVIKIRNCKSHTHTMTRIMVWACSLWKAVSRLCGSRLYRRV